MNEKNKESKKKKVSSKNRSTFSAPYMEQSFKEDLERKDKDKHSSTRFSIHVRSRRKKPTDSDGVSAKAAIDGLVHCKLLEDDSAKEVKEVTYSQEKGSPEQTIIEIYR